jgi:tetratricopeptide (TPR) repeat protein
MNMCHRLMNEGLELHRTKDDYNIEKAINKYREALKHVPEKGCLFYPNTLFRVYGGNHIRSEIYAHIGYAYHDLADVKNANLAYNKALKYNQKNEDVKHDRKLPHGLRAKIYNQGASGSAKKYVEGDSLMPIVVIT